MRAFEDINPLILFLYYMIIVLIVMLADNPIIFFISFVSAIIYYLIRNGCGNKGMHKYTLGLFVIMALINPIVSHNGVTILFFMNDNPITLEACIYGLHTSLMIVAVLYWCYSFSQIMTSDKLLYIFGLFSSKLALMISMALRYIPLFNDQSKKVKQAQKAMGMYKDDNIIDNFKANVRAFSIMITWALENGIITAESMENRGYGIGKRSHFSQFKIRKIDVLLLTLSVGLEAFLLYGIGDIKFVYYPEIVMTEFSNWQLLYYIAYGVLVFIPIAFEIKETAKWAYLKSKI